MIPVLSLQGEKMFARKFLNILREEDFHGTM